MLAAALAGNAVRAPRAHADQAVVSAVIYAGSAGSSRSAPVSLSTLAGCPTYAGASPMDLYPAAQPYEPAAGSSWALATVLTCGLQIPLGNVDSVQVDSPNHGFEFPLSAPDLAQPSPFQDPSAYPVISNNGGQDQNTYTRPWRGGADQNAADQVTNNGPIALVVYENGAPLSVTAAQQTVSKTASSERVQLSATVAQPGGAAIPASSLIWKWSFQDGSASTEASPTHTFPSGISIVTVQVTDTATGTGGTATLQVVFNPSPASKGTQRRGAGNHHNGPPAGPKHGTGSKEGSQHGAPSGPQTKSTQPGSKTPAAAQSQTQTQTQTTSPTQPQSPTPTTTPPRTTPTRASHHRAPRRQRRTRHPAPTSAGRLVSGRLIADVHPLAPSSSPLVHASPATPAAAAAVRQAQTSPTATAIYAAITVAALLWLGARRQLPGRGRRRRAPAIHR